MMEAKTISTRQLPEGQEKKNREGVFCLELPVHWSDLDANGHLNNGRYQSYLDEARMHAFDATGMGVARMREQKQGPVIYEASLKYRNPVDHPETLRILTWLESTNRSRGVVRQEMYRCSDDALACEAEFHGIFMDFQRRRPIKFPEHFLAAFGLG